MRREDKIPMMELVAEKDGQLKIIVTDAEKESDSELSW